MSGMSGGVALSFAKCSLYTKSGDPHDLHDPQLRNPTIAQINYSLSILWTKIGCFLSWMRYVMSPSPVAEVLLYWNAID